MLPSTLDFVPSTLDPRPKPRLRKSITNTQTWKSRLSECGGSKQQQFRWLWEAFVPSRRTWKTTLTKSLATSTFILLGRSRSLRREWKSTLTEFKEQLASASSKKNDYSANSPHPQKRSVNQVNSLLPKCHGLDSVLQRLSKQAKITITI